MIEVGRAISTATPLHFTGYPSEHDRRGVDQRNSVAAPGRKFAGTWRSPSRRRRWRRCCSINCRSSDSRYIASSPSTDGCGWLPFSRRTIPARKSAICSFPRTRQSKWNAGFGGGRRFIWAMSRPRRRSCCGVSALRSEETMRVLAPLDGEHGSCGILVAATPGQRRFSRTQFNLLAGIAEPLAAGARQRRAAARDRCLARSGRGGPAFDSQSASAAKTQARRSSAKTPACGR